MPGVGYGSQAGLGFDGILIEVEDFFVGDERAREVVEFGQICAEDQRASVRWPRG